MSKRVHSRRAHKLRTEFFEEGRRLDADPDPEMQEKAKCWICRSRIDYEVDPSTTPDSHNLDHYFPVDDYPELQEDPDNFRHAHFSCNASRGKGSPEQGLGEEMPAWW